FRPVDLNRAIPDARRERPRRSPVGITQGRTGGDAVDNTMQRTLDGELIERALREHRADVWAPVLQGIDLVPTAKEDNPLVFVTDGQHRVGWQGVLERDWNPIIHRRPSSGT